MTSPAGLKQTCPNCGLRVSIRQRALIGKRIECPKCRTRYVVTDRVEAVRRAAPAREEETRSAAEPSPGAGPARPGVWGIDLGQCALKAIRLESVDGRVVATAFDYIEHPKLLSQPDADPAEFIRAALDTFVARNALEGDTVVISVPGQSGLARFVKLPPVEEKKIGDIIRFEAKQQIPFPLDSVFWDFQKISGGNAVDGFALEVEVGLFAMKLDLLNRHLQHFVDAGIDVEIVQMAPLTLANFVTHDLLAKDGRAKETAPDQSRVCVVALDIGTDSSNLVITDGERIFWQRSIPIGGTHFTRALTKDLKLTFAKAEHVKRNAAKSAELNKITHALEPVLMDLVVEVQRSLGYFTNTHRDARIEYLIGSGNAFRLHGLQKYLQDRLELEVRRLDRFAGLTGDGVVRSPVFAMNSASFAVAYGLALQGLGRGRLCINLLPPEFRGRHLGEGWTTLVEANRQATAHLDAVGRELARTAEGAKISTRWHVQLSLAWFIVGWELALLGPWLASLSVVLPWTLGLAFCSITAALIAWNVTSAMRLVIRTLRTVDALPFTLVQIPLFALLLFQVAAYLGADHYESAGPPGTLDWLLFGTAHAVRAADLPDFLEAYGLHIQTIHNASVLSGAVLIIYHLVLDLFLLSLLLDWLARRRQAMLSKYQDLNKVWPIVKWALGIIAVGFVVVFVPLTAWEQEWGWLNFLLWPVDNALRALDFPDIMWICQVRLHQVPRDFWEGTLAFLCRAVLCVALLPLARRGRDAWQGWFIHRFSQDVRQQEKSWTARLDRVGQTRAGLMVLAVFAVIALALAVWIVGVGSPE